MTEFTVLRIVSIKGRVASAAVAQSLGLDPAAVQSVIDELVGEGFLKPSATGFRVTAAGRQRCAELVGAERATVNADTVAGIYHEFCDHNDELKEIITDWQMRDGSTPNDHADADYDQQVLARLHGLHERVSPLLDRIAATAPRLAHYPDRLAHADKAIADGDLTFVSRPITDSYHTVWFELHEDLIGLAGLTRADEADAGRGA
jgi:hypothetical protein